MSSASSAKQGVAWGLVALLVVGALGGYWGCTETERIPKEREAVPVSPHVDKDSVQETGYIYETRIERKLTLWFVRIPATNRKYSCSWERGYAGFRKNDAVSLIHVRDQEGSGSYDGYLVGLHGKQKGLAASVWAVDIEVLQDALDSAGTGN